VMLQVSRPLSSSEQPVPAYALKAICPHTL
jgi:hypothetical protein